MVSQRNRVQWQFEEVQEKKTALAEALEDIEKVLEDMAFSMSGLIESNHLLV